MNYEITISVHVPDELLALRDSLTPAIAASVPPPPAPAKAVAAPPAEPEPVSEVTRESVIALARDVLKEKGRPALDAVWKHFGVDKLKAIEDEQLAEVADKLQEAL